MAEKRIEHNDLIEDNVFQPSIESALALQKALQGVKVEFEGIAKVSNSKAQSNPLGNTADISAFNSEVERGKVAITELNKVKAAQVRAEEQLKIAQSGATQELIDNRLEIQRVNRELKNNSIDMSKTTGAYEKASLTLNKLRKDYKNLVFAGKENTQATKDMLAQIQKLDGQLKIVDASVGQHQRSVGNYSNAFSGLKNSVNQVTRELPAFTVSMQTGFLGISNNLPILADSLKKINLENKALASQGKKTTSSLLQLGKAMFSWGSVLSVGITLLTVYGADIVDFIVGTDEAAKAQKGLEEATENANESLAKEKVEMDILFTSLKSTNAGTKERSDLIDKINSTYGTTLKNLKDEEKFASQIALAYTAISKQIENKITLQIIEGQLTEIKKREMEAITKLGKARERESKTEVRLSELKKKGGIIITKNGNAITKESLALRELNTDKEISLKREKELNDIKEEGNKLLSDAAKLQVGLLGSGGGSSKDSSSTKSKAAKSEKDIYADLQKSRIALIEDEEKQKIALLKFTLSERVKSIKKEFKASKERAELILNTEKDFQNQINDIISEGNRKRLDIIADGVKETQKAIDEAEKGRTKAAQDAFNNIQKERKDEEDKQKDLRKQAAEDAKSAFNTVDKLQENATNRKLSRIDREIEANKNRQTELRILAAQGQQDAQNSLALAEKRELEIQRKREQIIKRQQRNELVLSGFKSYASKVEKGDANPLFSTIKDLTALSSALQSVPLFFEGAENIGDSLGNPQIKGRDGYVVRVDGSERVLTGKQNAMVGDMSNEDLAQLAYQNRMGEMNPIYVSNSSNDKTNYILQNEVKELRRAIENRPVNTFDYDKVSDMVIERVKKGNKIETNFRKSTI